jgi:hypothetical protein
MVSVVQPTQKLKQGKAFSPACSPQNAPSRHLLRKFKWAGLGNLLGDYGEFIATEVYGFKKAPAGSNGFDAITPEGATVQVKANFAANQIGLLWADASGALWRCHP